MLEILKLNQIMLLNNVPREYISKKYVCRCKELTQMQTRERNLPKILLNFYIYINHANESQLIEMYT